MLQRVLKVLLPKIGGYDRQSYPMIDNHHATIVEGESEAYRAVRVDAQRYIRRWTERLHWTSRLLSAAAALLIQLDDDGGAGCYWSIQASQSERKRFEDGSNLPEEFVWKQLRLLGGAPVSPTKLNKCIPPLTEDEDLGRCVFSSRRVKKARRRQPIPEVFSRSPRRRWDLGGPDGSREPQRNGGDRDRKGAKDEARRARSSTDGRSCE